MGENNKESQGPVFRSLETQQKQFLESKTTRISSHFDSLVDSFEIRNHTIVDVGCGFGELCFQMSREAQNVVGVECSKPILQELKGRSTPDNLTFAEGKGESLPLATNSQDLVVYLNSFHHVASENWRLALQEVLRVLKKEGRLYVAEPIPFGDYFSITRLVDDEFEIRNQAYQKLLDSDFFEIEKSHLYWFKKLFKDFDEFKNRSVSIATDRQEAFRQRESEIIKLFEEKGKPTETGLVSFLQPMRTLLMRQRPNH